jgi:putative DNA primase/helicase
VASSTDEYFSEQDFFGQWIVDHVERVNIGTARVHTLASELYASWKLYADVAGVEPGSQASFGCAMRDRGYDKAKDGAGRRTYLGVRLRRNRPGSGCGL